MTSEADQAPAFTLEYDMQPEDVREAIVATPGVKGRLIRMVVAAILLVMLTASSTALTVMLKHRSATNGSAAVPDVIYAVDLALWLVTALVVWAAWLHRPGRLTRVAIQKIPEYRGRTCDRVDAGGIRMTSANGTEVFQPWAAVDRVRETPRTFYLLDRNDRVLAVLPKRGLDSPDRLPALRTFLQQALAQPPAAAASTATDGSAGRLGRHESID